jgi:hypothetical protein
MVSPGARVYANDINDVTYNKPIVRLVQAIAQPLTSGVNADLIFDTGSTEIDTHNFHSETVNPTRVTPTVPGVYRCRAHLHIASSAGNLTQVVMGVSKNGTRVTPHDVFRPDPTTAAGSTNSEALVQINGSGDYITATVQQQNSTAAVKNTSVGAPFASVLEIEYVRPLP